MKGKILLIILGKENKVYIKYTFKPCPFSDIKSRKLTACIIQTITEILMMVIKKKRLISFTIFLKINFFIEILKNTTYIHLNFCL